MYRPHPRTAIARALNGAAVSLDATVDRDQLTGLATRAELMRSLDRMLEQDGCQAVLYVDLDDFKLVNDTLGHAAGDELLRHVATAMQAHVRADDLLARLGGDEFVAVCDDPEAAEALAVRLRRAITAPVCLRGLPVSIGASIGIAIRTGDGDASDLLEAADAAMYEAKRNGRNQICRADTPARRDRERRRESLELTTSLPKAVARDELVLHWQPLVSVKNLSLVGLEALVRWQHPERGLLGPDLFLPFAEQTGMIHAVDEWVAAAVSRQRLQWRSIGLDPHVGFNLAPQVARRPGALASLLAGLTVGGLSLDKVTVELTESEALREDGRLVGFLAGLREAGVTIALDDFGRAYSSLDRLREVPARWVKLDRAFMERVPEDPAATGVLTAILDLVAALGLEMIVEGIERPAQLEVVRERGNVKLAQGFLLGRPMPAAELEQRLRATPRSQFAPNRAARAA